MYGLCTLCSIQLEFIGFIVEQENKNEYKITKNKESSVCVGTDIALSWIFKAILFYFIQI